ncbi:MAG: alpha-amylase family glycosyl hydrolase [Terriglobales bacterium]
MPALRDRRAAAARRLQLAFAFLLTMRGEPMIYYGDEIGMTGSKHPDNRRNFPGGFPGARQDAFTAAGPAATAHFPPLSALIYTAH